MEQIKKFEKGDLVFKTQENASHFYIVKSGQVLCFRREHQRIFPIGNYGPGDIFGEDSVMAGKFYQYFAICTDDSELVEVSRKDFDSYIDSTNKWVGRLSSVLAKRVAESQAYVSEHKVTHECLMNGDEFTPELENFVFNSLKKFNV